MCHKHPELFIRTGSLTCTRVRLKKHIQQIILESVRKTRNTRKLVVVHMVIDNEVTRVTVSPFDPIPRQVHVPLRSTERDHCTFGSLEIDIIGGNKYIRHESLAVDV